MFNINHPACSFSAGLGWWGSGSRCWRWQGCSSAPFRDLPFYRGPRAKAVLGSRASRRARCVLAVPACSRLVGYPSPCAYPCSTGIDARLFWEVNTCLQVRLHDLHRARVLCRASPVLCRLPARGCCSPSPWEPGWVPSPTPKFWL